MERRMIIVGAGIAGLATGCYARMNGYDTTILEAHSIAGGLCTAWKRKGYTFDISMHMLVGSKSGATHKMWDELGALEDQEFHYHDESIRVESGGKRLAVVNDPVRLEEQLVALSPEDAELSREFVRLYSGRSMMSALSLTPAEMVGPIEGAKGFASILPFLGVFRKYGATTIQEFAERFTDPFLRDAIRYFIDSPGWPMQRYPMVAMAGMMKAAVMEAGVPVGGSKGVIDKIARRYEQLGGRARYDTRVVDILIEDDRAVGVRLADGSEMRADEVVWAADGHTAIFDILGGRYVSDEIRAMYEEWIPVQPLVHVMIGVDRDFSREPHRLVFEVPDPITVGGTEHRRLSVLHHSFDPTMAPPGKSAVEVWYATEYDYWATLAEDREAYRREKERIARETIAALDRRWPGFADQVEVVDVPTPATYVRYTGNWKASPDGWYVTPENMAKRTVLRRLPGLSAFHMVGQWTVPFAGTVMSALSGRQLVQLLCKRDRRRFVTRTPSPAAVGA